MSNVFEEIYQESFQNQLTKIAQANKMEPEKFVTALEKVAIGAGLVKGVKTQVGHTGASYKNLLDAISGLYSAAKSPKGGVKGVAFSAGGMGKFKEHIGKAKRAVALTAGVPAAAAGAYQVTK
jgi:hypothetical protein